MPLSAGTRLGPYEIVSALGAGGMGEVYRAHDPRLGRDVAVKVLPAAFSADPDRLRRFEQEARSAAALNHPNILALHDIGIQDDVPYVVSELLEGMTLRDVLARSTPSVEQTVGYIVQVATGLAAAHEKGIVHRDLKPENLFITCDGHVKILDFGLAKVIAQADIANESAAQTVLATGVNQIVGTPGYMAPEQVLGGKIDHRTDIFALGAVLFESLSGRPAFDGPDASSKIVRMLSGPPPSGIDSPHRSSSALNAVVHRALSRRPEDRYQSAIELRADLQAVQATGGLASTQAWSVTRMLTRRTRWRVVISLIAVIMIALFIRLGFPIGRSSRRNLSSAPSVTLAVLGFRNASEDRTLDWLGSTLAEMLRNDLGQSMYLRTVSAARLDQILRDLRLGHDATFDPSTLGRLAEFSGAQALIWGQYARFGSRLRIDATLQDLRQSRTIPLKVEASDEQDVIRAVEQLAESVQRSVATSPDLLKELRAAASRPSSNSLPALRSYNEGLRMARQGNYHEAVRQFEASINADSDFALAHSQLGQAYAALGHEDQAERSSRRAVDLSTKLPARERFLILANHARVLNDNKKAIETYENLAKVSPTDADVQVALAQLYARTGAFDKAQAEYASILARDPKYLEGLYMIGQIEAQRGNPQGAIEYLNRGLTLAVELENDEEKARILHTIGIAYKLLNKPDEARRYYEEALAMRRRLGQKSGIAGTLGEIAQIDKSTGKPDEALAKYSEALRLQREIGDKRGAAVTLNNVGNLNRERGQYDAALKLFKESLQIWRETSNESGEALGLNNIGVVYSDTARYDEALTYFRQALQLREKLNVPADIAQTLHNLAETSSNVGQYDQALTQYLRALELYRGANQRRGMAIESHAMGTIFSYQGRYRTALNAREEALKTLRAIGDKSFWLSAVLGGYGNALTMIGRGQEADTSLAEALGLANDLKNEALIAQTLNYQGDRLFYAGDYKAARGLFSQALQVAARTMDRRVVLVSQFNLAKVAVKEGRAENAIGPLTQVARQADGVGLRGLSTEASVYFGESLLDRRDYSRATQVLEAALSKSEKLGLPVLTARSHHLLAMVLQRTGQSKAAAPHSAEADRILDEIRKEAGSDDVLKRADLKPILAARGR